MGPLPLGAFRLLAPIAQGGSGEVWRAMHEATHLPVAVKLFPGSSDPQQRRAFQREVRSVASLDHPHVIAILDIGEVSSDDAGASAGRLAAGTPWIALEYASGGSLSEVRPISFIELYGQLVAIIEALAHAHAHGIVHGDLKPSNVLWCSSRDPRPGLKLSDFGVARQLHSDDLDPVPLRSSAGTPPFMSPEQVLGGAGRLTPASDLYSLGCVAWALCTGRSPFQRDDARSTARAHLEDDLPPFLPAFPVPAGFLPWVEALLTRDALGRPQRAADALAALEALATTLDEADEEDELTMSMGPPPVAPDDPTQYGFDDLPSFHDLDAPVLDPAESIQRIGPPSTLGPRTRPWHRRPRVLMGAGLGLVGLRELPLLGRDSSQQALWDELRQVHVSRRPRAVLVHGAPGVGKSALVRWLARRADEVGAARWAKVEPEPGGVVAALVDLLDVRGMTGDARARRLRHRMPSDEEVAAVEALIDGSLGGNARRGALLHTLGRVAEERPLIWWVEDAHRQREALAIARELVHRTSAVLCVVTVNDDRMAQGSPEGMDVDALEAREIELKPIGAGVVVELLEGSVGLEASLARRVAQRVGGQPLLLMQLLSAWSRRGWLASGPQGLELPQDVPLELPDDLTSSWLGQVEEAIDPLEPAAGWDLQVAATLGERVPLDLWHTACDDPYGEGEGWDQRGLARRRELLDALSVAQLVVEYPGGFRFAHRMLCEAIVDQAVALGRAPLLNEACANALLEHGRGGAALGTHLRAAGKPFAAIRPLLDGANALLANAPRGALPLVMEAEEAAADASLDPADPTSGDLLVLRARAHLGSGEREEALRWARWAQKAARTHGPHQRGAAERRWWEHLRDAMQVEHRALWLLDRRDEAAAVLPRLAPVVRKLGDPVPLGDLLVAQAQLHMALPDGATAAIACLTEAVAHFRDATRPDKLAAARIIWSDLELGRGRLRDAADTLDDALREGTGDDPGLHARLLEHRGEVAMLSGELDDAKALLQRARAATQSVGRPTARVDMLRGLTDSLLGHTAPGAARLQQLADDPAGVSRPLLHLATALTEARVRRWGGVQEQLRAADRLPLARGPLVSWLAKRLASEAEVAGFGAIAARARSLC